MVGRAMVRMMGFVRDDLWVDKSGKQEQTDDQSRSEAFLEPVRHITE
jgi:hypothetical protein